MKEFRTEVWEICEILLLAQESLKVVESLVKNEEDENIAYTKGMIIFFRYTGRIYWRVVVIELAKLLSKRSNERYSIFNLIKKIKPAGQYGDAHISGHFIDQLEKSLKENEVEIDNLIEQRDKLYAHTDANSKSIINILSVKKTRDLIELAQSIIKEIYSTVFHQQFMFDSPIPSVLQSLDYVVQTVTDGRKTQQQYFLELGIAHKIESEI